MRSTCPILASLIIAIAALFLPVDGDSWHRYGIGKINRVVAAPQNNTHFIAASEKGVLARFEHTHLHTVWRAPPVNTDDVFQSISIVQGNDDTKDGGDGNSKKEEYFLVATVESPQFVDRASTVRVYNSTSGVFLWDAPGCKFAQVASNVLAVRSCTTAGNNDKNAGYDIKYIRLENGTLAGEHEFDDTISEKEWKKMKNDHGSGKQRGNGDIFWSPTFDLKKNGEPAPAAFDVLSHPGGRISLRKRGMSVELVSRNEGSAHTSGAVFLSSNNGYIRPMVDKIDDVIMDDEGNDNGSDEIDVLVTISEFGSLFAYDLKSSSYDGKQLWLHDDSTMDVRKLARNKCTLVPGHVYHAVVLCVNRDANKRAFSEVKVYEGSSGNILFRHEIARFRAVHPKVLPNCCTKNDVCVQLIDKAGNFRFVTSCKSKEYRKKQVTAAEKDHTFISVGEAPEGNAYKIQGERDGKTMWRFQLPPGYVVERIAKSRPVHHTARKLRIEPFRVTDDRKLLHKSIDPSKILVMAASGEEGKKSKLMVSILDGKSGVAYKIINHVNASQPFSSIAWENWFVYSYWNTYLLQQELHVVDMYRTKSKVSFVADNLHRFAQRNLPIQALEFLGNVFPELKKYNNNMKSSSSGEESSSSSSTICSAEGTCSGESLPRNNGNSKVAPEFLHTAFLLSHQVTEISHSETDGGITENSLLFGLTNGQVVSLSRLLVDARRPRGDAHYSSTESLMPYYPYLSFHPSDHQAVFLTNDKFIAGLKGIAVAPAKNRESSCHVASFGVDLNYKRFTPAGSAFDTLPDDFGFKAVIGSVAGLIIAAVYSNRAVEGKFLYESWFNE